MIQIKNIFVKYGDRVLMNNISTTIKKRDRIGLAGRNGAGKSTLLKILANELSAQGGTIEMPTNTSIGFLHQDIFIPEDKTVLEETLTAFEEAKKTEKLLNELNEQIATRTDYESEEYNDLLIQFSELSEHAQILDHQTINAKTQRVLMGLGFKDSDMNRLVKEFSGGWKMRIELAKILLREPDYMLLDEPTNHLDIEAIMWLESFLENYTGGIILISHDKTFLDTITNKTIEIEKGKLYEYAANYSTYLEKRVERREMLKSQYENQQKYIAEKERTIERFRAKANKAKMAQSMIKELARLERIEMDQEVTSAMRIKFPPAPRAGAIPFGAIHLTKAYGELMVLEDVDLRIEKGEKIAFVGQNGQGKSTLSKIVAGEIPTTSGVIEFGHNVKLGYYAQDQADNLDAKVTVLESMEDACPAEMRTKIRGILGAFMFSGEDVNKKVSVLSGGERARLAMAKLLLHPINLLVMDEPTNHLDILSKEVLKSALNNYDGTLIVVSHDRDFLHELTDRTIEFRDRKLYDYIGDLTEFLEKRKAENMRQVELRNKQKKTKAQVTKEPVVNQSIDKDLQRKQQNIERKIEKLEQKIKSIEFEMGKEGFYESENSESILSDYATRKKELENMYAKWEEFV